MLFLDNKELENYEILSFSLSSKVNEHNILKISFISLVEISFAKELCYVKDNNVLKASIKKIIQKKSKDKIIVEIEALSFSYSLDIVKKERIFQDEKLTYKEIIEYILKDYNIKYVISNNLNIKTNRLYLQYDETDFEFIRRILADISEVISNTYNGILVIGFQKISPKIIKNIDYIGYTKDSEIIGITDDIVISMDEIEGKYVSSSCMNLSNGIIKVEIELKYRDKFSYRYLNNSRGLFLTARVVEVKSILNKACVKVDFDIIQYGKEKKFLSFSTPYSKDMTGLFVSPCINDKVDVYFPDNNENNLKVAFCIDNEGSGRFCDVNNRKFITTNAEISISKDEIILNSKNIIFQSQDTISLASNRYIGLESVEDISIYSNDIGINSKANDIKIKSNNNILLVANKIFNN